MAVINSATSASALPFLQPPAPGIRLRFPQADSLAGGTLSSSPDYAGPFAELHPAQVVIDDSGTIAELFCLVQPDQYPTAVSSELRPVHNPDVENSWQAAFVHLRDSQTGGMPPAWASQVDARGRLLPFDSLFYCQHKQVYCRPLCPACGRLLVLCRDDRMLAEAGLAGYKDSLQRYLHCPDCCRTSAEAPYYSKVRPPHAPPRVRGGADLIQDFSRLLNRSELAGDLPCIGCEQATHCYGAQPLALERMQAVHFYPFFMLTQPAPTLNALDFAALLGGSEPPHIEQHLIRQHKNGRLDRWKKIRPMLDEQPGFLFAVDGRRFLEILYLKLTFLRELHALIGRGASEPVSRMSMEGVWVRLAENSMRLPYLWNFRLQLIDSIGLPEDRSTDATSRARRREFLAAAWHYVLLVNAGQTMETVTAAIEKIRVAVPADGGTAVPTTAAEGVFEARNIFWQTSPFVPDAHEQAFWDEALRLGIDLLNAGLDPDEALSEEAFAERLDNLRERVHQALFAAPAAGRSMTEAPAAQTTAQPSNDPQIVAVLSTILEQWPVQGVSLEETRLMTAPVAQPGKDQDYAETVVLSSREYPVRGDADAQPEPAPAVSAPDPGISSSQADARPDDDLAETVILSDAASVAGGDEEKTMIISPKDPRPSAGIDASAGVPHPAPSAQKPPEEEDLEKTVILQPQPGKNRGPMP
jgi:hypothetical protein